MQEIMCSDAHSNSEKKLDIFYRVDTVYLGARSPRILNVAIKRQPKVVILSTDKESKVYKISRDIKR